MFTRKIRNQESDPPVDILDSNDVYVCSCRISAYNDTMMRLARIPGKGPLPVIKAKGIVKARGHDADGQPVDVKGTVRSSDKDLLCLTNIKITKHENRRRHVRYTVQEPCCFLRRGKLYTGRLVNISLGGACIVAKTKLKLNEDIGLKFQGLRLSGETIRIMPGNDLIEYGIIFHAMNQATLDKLQDELDAL
ncbi:MAG: PilZ domain-containing protein [Clostridia bacterium]|nr:PilZ domain-containing protein [Clostridia bacterium]